MKTILCALLVFVVSLVVSPSHAQEWRPVRNAFRAITPPIFKAQPQQCATGTCATGTCSIQESAITTYTVVQPQVSVQSASLAVETQGVAENIVFLRALLKAASNQRRAGNITIEEYLVIARSARNPEKLQELRDSMADAAVEEGLATTTAINWDGLIAFIEKLLPIILKLIDMFGINGNPSTAGMC
jgi:hypothetical protein